MSRAHGPRTAGPHVATESVAVAAEEAFAFLTDGLALGRWALGCFDTTRLADDLVAGHSLFDGEAAYVRIVGDPRALAVTYHVGSDPERLAPRIAARIERCASAGGVETCRVSLIAERMEDMTDERWRQLTVTHEAEILLIKAQLARLREGRGGSTPAQSSPIR